MSQARKLRVPGEAPEPVARVPGFTRHDAPPKLLDRPVSPIPAALAGVDMVASDPRDLDEPTLDERKQARAMADAMAPVVDALTRGLDRTETPAVALPPKHSAPMYEFADIEQIVREGRAVKRAPVDALALYGMQLPLLTTRGWLIEVGPKFGAL